MHEPGLAARSRRADSTALLAELHQALRIGQAAVFLCRAGGGKRNTSVAMSSGRNSPRSTSGELYHQEALSTSTMSRTTSHFSFDMCGALQAGVRSADSGILAHDEQAVHLAVCHVEPVAEVRVVAGNARQVVEAPVVFFRRVVAVLRLHQADEVVVESCSTARRLAVCLLNSNALKSLASWLEERHRQVAGQNVIQRGNVGGTLNRRVAAQTRECRRRDVRCCPAASAGSRPSE